MTSPGHHLVHTPLAGLVDVALTAPTFERLGERAAQRPAELALVGPASARLFTTAALARQAPLLVITATGREADDLTAELRGAVGDTAAMFPSWETLPHERLSPGVDTVGARMLLLRRLAFPDDAALGPPLRVVVATVRSLLQPMAPQLGRIEPVTLTVGAEVGFDELTARLVELAYTRVDMVGRRGEFAVRGGILDVFAPTAEHPVRIEFWGDEVTEMRMFSVADQRSIPEVAVETVVAVPCRELLLTAEVRRRAAHLADQHPSTENAVTGTVADMLAKLAAGIPVDGMEALLPVLRADELTLLTDQIAEQAAVLVCDPEKVRARAADLIATGREFLEASWSAAAIGGDQSQAPVDVEALGGSGFRDFDAVAAGAAAAGRPWWTLSQLSDESAIELDCRAAPSARSSARHRRDHRDAARARGDRGVRDDRGARHRHRPPRRRAAHRSPDAGGDVGPGVRAEAGRRGRAAGSAARRDRRARRAAGHRHRDRPDR
jgi:transcription-repair coupling factor (superfamily II helicase)